jgi:hypothetical protein
VLGRAIPWSSPIGPRTPEAGSTYSKESRLLVVDRSEADLGVDIEVALLSARRPDGGLNAELVGLEVVVVVRTSQGQSTRDLLGNTGEVVGSLADTLVSLLEVGIATVVNLEDRVLPLSRISATCSSVSIAEERMQSLQRV